MWRRMCWVALGVLGIGGCEGTQRSFSGALRPDRDAAAAGSSAAGNGPGLGNAERPRDLALGPTALDRNVGAACVGREDCLSGLCVDGVCCRTSCDGVCSRCDAPGSEGECTLAANDAACALNCPLSSDCRSYGSGALSANCEAVGLCRSLADCAATNAPAGRACQVGAGICDGQGECVVSGKRRLGEACQADEECGEGHCVVGSGGASICCDAACGGLCQTCGAGGHCSEIPRDDARCQNVDCPADDLCRDYVADLDVNLCRGFGQCRTAVDCSFSERRPGAECSCDESGCLLANGAICSSAAECASTVCQPTPATNSVCCAEDCAARGLNCAVDGSRCVQCDASGAECVSPALSRLCAGEVLTEQICGNGCDVSTGLCSTGRPTGSVCDTAGQCQSGVCNLDVTGTNRCCSAGCEASDRACGADGACVCPGDRQDVNGTCRLRLGQACTQGGDCASGACVAQVSGGSVCCADGCAGSFCAADGASCVQCAGAGSTCQGNIASRCENGSLIATPCGNGCNATTGVCDGLLGGGQACTAGAQCATNSCTPDLNGTQRCCTPNCAASGRVCGADGACVCASPNQVFVGGACRSVEGQTCGADGDCRSGACENNQAGAQVCCTGTCNNQICRANGQGCVACEGGAPSCQGNNSRSCSNNAFVTTTCANGCNASTGQCNNLIPRGSTGCTQNAQCAGSGASCQGGRCCEFNCQAAGRSCDGAGICQCPTDRVAFGNACLIPNGSGCTRSDECASQRCDQWYPDLDDDKHGDPTQPLSVCGNAGAPPPRADLVPSSDDCCDLNPDIFTGQSAFFATPHPDCNGLPRFDYDCDGFPTKESLVVADCTEPVCQSGTQASTAAGDCGAPTSFGACSRLANGPVPCFQVAGGPAAPISCR